MQQSRRIGSLAGKLLVGLAAWGLVGLTDQAGAQPAPYQNAEGRRLAQDHCSTCHVIAPSTRGGWTDAPSFQAIANRPNESAARLSAFIQQEHMRMMHDHRPKPEADALAAYIVSLRGR